MSSKNTLTTYYNNTKKNGKSLHKRKTRIDKNDPRSKSVLKNESKITGINPKIEYSSNLEITENTIFDRDNEVLIEISDLEVDDIREILRNKSRDVFKCYKNEIDQSQKLTNYKAKIKDQFKNIRKNYDEKRDEYLSILRRLMKLENKLKKTKFEKDEEDEQVSEIDDEPTHKPNKREMKMEKIKIEQQDDHAANQDSNKGKL